MTNTSLTLTAYDWRPSRRFVGFTLFDLSGQWLRGQWWTVTVALLGVRVTLTRYLVIPLEPTGLGLDFMEHAP